MCRIDTVEKYGQFTTILKSLNSPLKTCLLWNVTICNTPNKKLYALKSPLSNKNDPEQTHNTNDEARHTYNSS